MTAGIFVSSVLIDCLRAKTQSHFLQCNPLMAARARTARCRRIGYRGRDKGEQTLIDSFLRSFDITIPNEADGLTALGLYRQFRLSHGVDWPDCQIAATALRLRAEVFTQNVKHFSAFTGLGVVKAY